MKTDRFATRKEDLEIAKKRKNFMVYNNPVPQPLFIEEGGSQKKIGELNKGDLVYIKEDNGEGVVGFLVVKFVDLSPENQLLVFAAKKSSFIPHEVQTETFANVEGNKGVVDKDGKAPSEKKFKNNYAVPLVAGMGGAVIGYLAARRVNQSGGVAPNGVPAHNVFVWAVVGAATFAALGYIATQMEIKKSSPDLSGSTITIPDAK